MKTLKITYNIHLYGPILCKEITLQLTNQFQVFRQKTFIIDDHLLIFTGPIQFSSVQFQRFLLDLSNIFKYNYFLLSFLGPIIKFSVCLQ